MSFVTMLLIMFILTVAGIPLMYSILFSSIIIVLLFTTVPITVVGQLFMNGIDSSSLQALAFFFLAGELMSAGGITNRIVNFVSSFLGWIKGSIAYINIFSCMFFGCISGSAVASTAAIGTSLIPEMKKRGYSASFSAALTQSSSIMGPIIPPSVPMVIFAALAGTGVSVGKMFLAGIIPGVIIAVALAITVFIVSHKKFREDKRIPFSFKKVLKYGKDAIFAILCPLIILGGILTGVFTATEAGAVAVVYAFIVGIFFYKELHWKNFYKALANSMKGTARIMLIVGASTVFAWLIARLRISHGIADWIQSISNSPIAVLLIINIIVFFIGMVMDPVASLTILVPVFMPIVTNFGISPIHFGIVLIFNLMIGLITPPVGYLMYLSASIAKTEPLKVLKQSIPFLVTLFIVLLFIIFIPSIATWLPSFMEERA